MVGHVSWSHGLTQQQFMYPKLVFWVLARIYYPIPTYMPIIEVCCMIFHNSIPCRFTTMHSIIDVVAWPYATTFCLSADLMKIQVRTLVILFTLHKWSIELWHGFAPQHPECLAGLTSTISVSFTGSINWAVARSFATMPHVLASYTSIAETKRTITSSISENLKLLLVESRTNKELIAFWIPLFTIEQVHWLLIKWPICLKRRENSCRAFMNIRLFGTVENKWQGDTLTLWWLSSTTSI
jgi:hypothetical protein